MLNLARSINEAAPIDDINLIHSRDSNGRYPVRELIL
jgi:hypothetical protein